MELGGSDGLSCDLTVIFFSGSLSGLREDKDLVVSISSSYPLTLQNNSPLVVQAGTREIGMKDDSLFLTHCVCQTDLLISSTLTISFQHSFIHLPYQTVCGDWYIIDCMFQLLQAIFTYQ